MTNNRWTDEFLDRLRAMGDPEADACYSLLEQDGEINEIEAVFRKMDSNDDIPPHTLFPQLSDFFSRTRSLPPGTDLACIRRGEELFCKHAFEEALILLTKGLPEGYAAPNLSIILNISGDLRVHPFKRLLSTLQGVVNVTTIGGFQDSGRAIITAQKLRLLHSGIRMLSRKYRPQFESQYGVPSNMEDMLGTIMGFSYLVIMGMRTLDVRLKPEQEEDCFYLWRIFSLMMGIYPPGEPSNMGFIPENVADAGLFYEAYKRRHYVSADKNPDGVALAAANLKMMKNMIPKFLRFIGLGVLPRLYMNELMGPEMCAMIGIRPVFMGWLLKPVLLFIQRWINNLEHFEKNKHRRFGMILFQGMINITLGGEVTFTVPESMQDMKKMAK